MVQEYNILCQVLFPRYKLVEASLSVPFINGYPEFKECKQLLPSASESTLKLIFPTFFFGVSGSLLSEYLESARYLV